MIKKSIDMKETGLKTYYAISNAGYTYRKVAEVVGLSSQRVVYDWVNGKKLPSIEHLVALSYYLGIKIDTLVVTDEIF